MGFDSFLNPFSSKSVIVSINVGTRFLKLALLKKLPAGIELSDFSIEDISHTDEEELKGFIKEKISAFVKDRYIFEAGGCLVLNSEVSFSRRMNMPSMPINELRKALAWEIRDTLPFSVEDAMIDFQIIKEEKDAEGVKSIELILMAAQRPAIYDAIALLEGSTLTAENVSVIPGSITNIVGHADLENDLPIAVIDFGYKYTTICVFRDKDLIFTRTLILGYEDLINSMVAAVSTEGGVTQLSNANAEDIINQHGIPKEGQTIKVGGTALDSGRVLSMLRPIIENLAKEINNSFLHITERLQEPQVSKVYLCGIGARIKSIEEFFNDQLGIDTAIFPLENIVSLGEKITDQRKQELPVITTTVGGAMWTEKAANFLPLELRKKKREIVEKISFRVLVIGVIAAFFLAYVFVSLRQLDYTRRYRLMQLHKSALMSLRDSKDQINKMQAVLNSIRAGRVDGVLILKELSSITPRNIILGSIDYSESTREVKLSGVVKAEGPVANLAISEYIKILENSPVFESASLISSSSGFGDEDNPLLQFDLKCQVEPPIVYGQIK